MTKFTTVRSLLSALAKAMNLINPDMENHHQETAYDAVNDARKKKSQEAGARYFATHQTERTE